MVCAGRSTAVSLMPAVVSFWTTQCWKLLSWTHHFRYSGRCWISLLEKHWRTMY